MKDSQLMLIPGAGSRGDGADISPCGTYRYDLRRIWSTGPFRMVNFIMLNPSTADASQDDPTIRRCLGFARDWGFGGLVVTNLFAYRATDPRDLLTSVCDPVGPLNHEYIARWARGADLIVCAWGTHGWRGGRHQRVIDDLLRMGLVPHALKLTTDGYPAHPLYLKGDSKPFPMEASK